MCIKINTSFQLITVKDSDYINVGINRFKASRAHFQLTTKRAQVTVVTNRQVEHQPASLLVNFCLCSRAAKSFKQFDKRKYA